MITRASKKLTELILINYINTLAEASTEEALQDNIHASLSKWGGGIWVTVSSPWP